jgi:hypothetical protein
VLDFDVDLTSAAPIQTTADAPPYTLTWAAVTTDVNGAEFDDLLGDTLRITHLDVPDVASAEAVFLQLDIVADQMYFLDVYGDESVPDLSSAVSLPDGSPFPGFTSDGVWLVGIECTDISCFSPAPLLLAVVEAE